jgi:hypothetical protein
MRAHSSCRRALILRTTMRPSLAPLHARPSRPWRTNPHRAAACPSFALACACSLRRRAPVLCAGVRRSFLRRCAPILCAGVRPCLSRRRAPILHAGGARPFLAPVRPFLRRRPSVLLVWRTSPALLTPAHANPSRRCAPVLLTPVCARPSRVSRVRGALGLAAPSTLLRRLAFGLHMLAGMLAPVLHALAHFAAWRDASAVVVYDVDSAVVAPASLRWLPARRRPRQARHRHRTPRRHQRRHARCQCRRGARAPGPRWRRSRSRRPPTVAPRARCP